MEHFSWDIHRCLWTVQLYTDVSELYSYGERSLHCIVPHICFNSADSHVTSLTSHDFKFNLGHCLISVQWTFTPAVHTHHHHHCYYTPPQFCICSLWCGIIHHNLGEWHLTHRWYVICFHLVNCVANMCFILLALSYSVYRGVLGFKLCSTWSVLACRVDIYL